LFEEIVNIKTLIAVRTIDLSEPIDLYLEIAQQLQNTNRHNYISRAKFILEQCNDLDGRVLFDKYREDWGVYNFSEDLITVDDFKRGFLWKFRDHTTSWQANQLAKIWFLTSIEAQFIRRYELWTCDNGFDECIEVREGSYKEILNNLLKDGDYEVLCSPVFSKHELEEFIENYKADEGDYSIDEIIEDYIEANPNYNLD
jgi:hypothetical protein